MRYETEKICRRVKAASRQLALVRTEVKDRALRSMARGLMRDRAAIIRANRADLDLARRRGLAASLIDRLMLDDKRIAGMARALDSIAGQRDPVGEVMERRRRPNGLAITKVRVPIGVILIIYESRPNVTSDCAGLCLKSGNAVILRGGSEAIRSNTAIGKSLKRSLRHSGVPGDAIVVVEDTEHDVMDALLKQEGMIDLVMPRGGERLIRHVNEHARMPVIKHYKGVCHTFVDRSADIDMALDICYNAKVQRPGVCNAMETLLVHESVARAFLPPMVRRYASAGVEMRGCPETRRIVPGLKAAAERDWYTEYLDLIISIRVVRDVRAAVDHIMKYGSFHSDAIVTRDRRSAEAFLSGVDSACVYVNASTRFTDGGEFGKGAEIGISTDKIHARGPMGLEELTSYKYIIRGSGQIRT